MKINVKRVIGLISDTHTGSKFSLFPDGFKTQEGNTLGLNKGQKKLLTYWKSFSKMLDHWGADTIIHCADAIDGVNKFGLGAGLMTAEIEEQKKAHKILMEDIIKKRKLFYISGSTYHESIDSKVHSELANELGGRFLGAVANIQFKESKKIFNITHGEGGAPVYKETGMAKEILHCLARQAQRKLANIDVFIRGHLHEYAHVDTKGKHFVQLPCWETFVPNRIFLKSYSRFQPDIGGVVMFIDDADRIIVHHYLYPAVHIADFVRKV